MPPPTNRVTKYGPCDAYIRGFRVWELVLWRQRGKSDDTLLAEFPSLSRADLQAAWQYAADHSAEIDAAIRRHREWREDQEKGNKRKMVLICTIFLAVANCDVGSGAAEEIAGPETAWVGGCLAALVFVVSVISVMVKTAEDRRPFFCTLGFTGFLLMLVLGDWATTLTGLRTITPLERLLVWVLSMAGMFGGFVLAARLSRRSLLNDPK